MTFAAHNCMYNFFTHNTKGAPKERVLTDTRFSSIMTWVDKQNFEPDINKL